MHAARWVPGEGAEGAKGRRKVGGAGGEGAKGVGCKRCWVKGARVWAEGGGELEGARLAIWLGARCN